MLLSYSPRDKRLINTWAADHTMTLADGRPILALDMYEHAYHMDYGAQAAAYVDGFMQGIRWSNAAVAVRALFQGNMMGATMAKIVAGLAVAALATAAQAETVSFDRDPAGAAAGRVGCAAAPAAARRAGRSRPTPARPARPTC